MRFFGHPTVKDNQGELTLFSPQEISSQGVLKEVIPGELFMLTKIEIWDDLPGRVDFAFFTYQGNESLDLLMHGSGISGNLRECRHTYWGDDGYIFYPNAQKFKAIFKELAVYFDDME